MTADNLGSTSLMTRSRGRLTSLDILRGLAVVLMILSGMLPKSLPNWVDHGYQPHYKPDPITGIWTSALRGGDAVFDGQWKAFTWVDLVFPMFLFAMGAAIPIALSRQRDRFVSDGTIARAIFGRWLILLAFAVIVDNIIPPTNPAANPDTARLLTLASFGVAFLFFVRWPAGTARSVQISVRWIAGLVLATRIAGYAVRRVDLAGADPSIYFSWGRSDTIINVLAHTYLVAALAWMITQHRPLLRIVLLLPVMLLAHYCAISPKEHGDWLWMGGSAGGHNVPADWPWRTLFRLHDTPWSLVDVLQSPKRRLNIPAWLWPTPARPATQPTNVKPWLGPALNLAPLWDFTWYKYLFVVVPGTIVGDWLGRWSQRHSATDADEVSSRDAWISLLLAVLVCAGVCVGLRHYGFATLGVGGAMRTPTLTLILALPPLALLGWITLPRARGEQWIERRLFKAGGIALIVGLLLACVPVGRTSDGAYRYFEGGISKGPPATLSYYAISVGLCCVLLVGLLRTFDARRSTRQSVGPIAATGQNPLLAYYIGHAAFASLFGLSLFAFLGHPLGPNITTLDDLFGARLAQTHPWVHALGDVAKTGLIVGFVWMLTRARIFWRA